MTDIERYAMRDGLATIEQCYHLLEQANSFKEIESLVDGAELLRQYAKKVGLGREAQNEASEFKIRAQRKGGEMLAGTTLQGRNTESGYELSRLTHSLEDLGLTKYQSMTWQKVASVPEDAFEERIAEVRSHETWELTTADILKLLAGDNHRAMGTGENEWYTPPDVLEDVRALLGKIELDPASSDAAQKHVKAEKYFTIEDDALSQDWNGKVFLNPPYAQPAIEHFATKLVAEYQAGRVTEAVMLTHNYTDTRWFHVGESVARAICFTRGRIRFVSPDGSLASPTQGQAFFYLGERMQAFREIFASRGFVR